ncbi:hypothetical protein M8J75_012074 [Diaphorina citri]|nr:hypothetical protein M8J75_012074 [Diaphorina citri]
MITNNQPNTSQKTPIDENGGQTGNRLAEGEQASLVPPTDKPKPRTENNVETLLMELSSPSSATASDAESVVTISGQKHTDKRKRVDLSSPDSDRSPPNKKGAPEKAPPKDTQNKNQKKREKPAPSSKIDNKSGEAMDKMASHIDDLEKYLTSKKGGRITIQVMEHLSQKFSETREALDSLKRTFIDEVRQAVAVDLSDLVDRAIDKKLIERSRTPLANRPAARATRPASLVRQPPAASSPAVDVATAGPSNAWQTVAGRRKTMSQVMRDAPDPPPQPPVNIAPKTPKRRKRQKRKSKKPFSPRVGILIQPKEGETVETVKEKITKVADPSKMGIEKVIRSREGLRIEVAKTDDAKSKLEVLSRELANHGYKTKSLDEHRLPRVAILGADPTTAADNVLACLAYGNMAKDCKGTDNCSHCAGKHLKQQCPNPNINKPPICGVCGPGKKASHHPGSNKCPTHLRKLEMFRRTIHYGNA